MANEVTNLPVPTDSPTLSDAEARVLHESTYADRVVKLFKADNVCKDAHRLAGADFRKEVRSGYADTASERIAHARGES